MTSVGLDVSLKGGRGREGSLDTSRDIGSGDVLSHAIAVAAAKGNVVLAGNNERGASERRHLGCITNSHDLTSGNGLLGLLALNSEANIKHVGEEEGVLKSSEGGVGEVARWVVVLENCVVVTVNQVVNLGRSNVVPDLISVNIDTDLVKDGSKARNNIALNTVLLSKSLNARGRSVAEAERLVQASAVEIPASNDIRKELASGRVTGKDNTISVVGVESG